MLQNKMPHKRFLSDSNKILFTKRQKTKLFLSRQKLCVAWTTQATIHIRGTR